VSTLNKLPILLSSGLIFTVALGLAQKKDQGPAQGKPPRNLTQQADGHWSTNKQAEKSEGFEVHTVKPGDTLWDVTKQYLKDPYLWPQVWEMNPNVTNPHWIYPGDHLFIKKMVVVATSSEPAPPSQPEAQEVPAPPPHTQPPTETPVEAPPAETQPAAPVPLPVASQSDVYCAGFFSATDIKPEMIIVGGEESETKSLFSDRDIVYVNKGASSGIKPGEEFLILRRLEGFGKYGPSISAAKSKYGRYYQDIGRARVLLAHQNSATAEIVFACEEISVNDFLVPNEQRAIPVSRGEAPFDKFAPPSNKTAGKIFMSKAFRENVGDGQIVYIDVGQKQNVQVGDYFRVVRHLTSSNISLFNKSDYRRYRETFESVRKLVGELVVLRVEANTASALVTLSTETIMLGDGVELE
jgi:LysM repeat protein